MKNQFLFKGLSLSKEEMEKLDSRIEKEKEFATTDAIYPFEYKDKFEAWDLKLSQKEYYPSFPNGLYESEELAFIALSLYKANKNKYWTYEALYRMSKFILQGIQ